MLKSIVVAAVLLSTLSGCGYADRKFSGYTGRPTETCVDGVLYLQFTTGSTVKYLPDGHVATCR